jgi:UDP-N-acetylmuramoyl-L-alanyl-D-glutamate--2,6-diaminopimelate ligase
MNTPSLFPNPIAKSLPELLAACGVVSVDGERVPDISITSLAEDSRKVERGACFVAIRGSDVDGHRFVDAAVDSGAVVVVVDRDVSVPAGVARVVVKDTREALAKLAAGYFQMAPSDSQTMRLVGITGTNGKTTVAWLLRSILREAGKRPALLGTIEYDLVSRRLPAPLTTPGSIELCRHLAEARDAGAAYGVLEVSSHALDQRRCDGLRFSAVVFTNLSGDHLDYHGSMEMYGAAKRRLFDLRTTDGIGVVNVDDDIGKTLCNEQGGAVVSYALDVQNADVSARIEVSDVRGSRFLLKGRGYELPVELPLIGRYNVANALAAAATAEALGVDPDAIRAGLERIKAVPGRLQRVENDDCSFAVLVDYAHTDAALANALEALRPITTGRLICVFGCGGDRDRAKRPRMAVAVATWADVAYVTSDNPRTESPTAIIDEILPGFESLSNCRIEVNVDRQESIRAALAEAQSGDTVLIAGKGHETYQLIGDQVLEFDDVEVARKYIGSRAVVGELA